MSDKIKIYRTNKLINGETVSYAVVAFFSVFLLFALKQFLKLTFGISAPVALGISALFLQRVYSQHLKSNYCFSFSAQELILVSTSSPNLYLAIY